jgi:murein DD-endopeptidase MepM/ murein hydrolase activator NlpD
MRWHPIDHVWRFHDGLDIAASCGAPIVAAAAGRVVEVSYSPGYGHHLVIDHGQVGAHQLRTAYSHAQGYQVSAGDQVSTGQLVGWVGTTGASTGCHLHFSAWLDTGLTDPAPLLP